MQQIVAYETDLLEYGDIFDGSTEMTRKVEELKEQAKVKAFLPILACRRVRELTGPHDTAGHASAQTSYFHQ